MKRVQGAVKRSVTIRSELDRLAHDLVGERGFSALVNEGLERAIEARHSAELLAAFEAAHGPITAAELAAARRQIERVRSRKKKK